VVDQKIFGRLDEETLITRAFKFFDLNNDGTVNQAEFGKSMEKLGVFIPTLNDL